MCLISWWPGWEYQIIGSPYWDFFRFTSKTTKVLLINYRIHLELCCKFCIYCHPVKSKVTTCQQYWNTHCTLKEATNYTQNWKWNKTILNKPETEEEPSNSPRRDRQTPNRHRSVSNKRRNKKRDRDSLGRVQLQNWKTNLRERVPIVTLKLLP